MDIQCTATNARRGLLGKVIREVRVSQAEGVATGTHISRDVGVGFLQPLPCRVLLE